MSCVWRSSRSFYMPYVIVKLWESCVLSETMKAYNNSFNFHQSKANKDVMFHSISLSNSVSCTINIYKSLVCQNQWMSLLQPDTHENGWHLYVIITQAGWLPLFKSLVAPVSQSDSLLPGLEKGFYVFNINFHSFLHPILLYHLEFLPFQILFKKY